MNKCISDYSTIIFDCDGVVLDSNKVKTQAFFDIAEPWGIEAQNLLTNYHINNGGISRHKKVAYLLNIILPSLSFEIPADQKNELYELLLDNYAKCVSNGLSSCPISPFLEEIRHHSSNSKWAIVSGGDQKELNLLFKKRDIASYFDAGIFGSPDDKKVILERELASNNFSMPTLFLGDSKYDHLSASAFNIDFVFVSAWTEFKEWKSYITSNQITAIPSLGELLLKHT